MRQRVLLCLVLGGACLLAAICAAPALAATTGRSDTLVLHSLGHGKAALVRFTYAGTNLVPTTVWSGALASGSRLAAGSFDGAAADEALSFPPAARRAPASISSVPA